MPPANSPTVRRRRLAAELRGIRESRGDSGDVVAAALNWSSSKVSRYELARTSLKPDDVERLLDFYKITGTQRTRLMSLAHEASQRGWWEDLSDAMTPELQQFIGLEQEASSMFEWHTEVVPGLLQTEAYARHIIAAYGEIEPIAPAMIERRVRIRMQRQQVLTREQPVELTLVLDESMLERRVGDDSVMYEQLQRLAQAADQPNLTLRILPLSAEHAVFTGSFTIFRFGPEHDALLHDVVSTEAMNTDFYVEGERATYLHRLGFQILLGASLDEITSRNLILERAEARWSGYRT